MPAQLFALLQRARTGAVGFVEECYTVENADSFVVSVILSDLFPKIPSKRWCDSQKFFPRVVARMDKPVVARA